MHLEDLHCSFLQELVPRYLLYLSGLVGDDRGDVVKVCFILLMLHMSGNLNVSCFIRKM